MTTLQSPPQIRPQTHAARTASPFDQVLAICGFWEPLAFLRRRGTTRTDDERHFRAAHTRAMAEALAERGLNAVIWHGYKGLGLEAERAEMELTRQFFTHCHDLGIVTGAYCNFGTFFAETMFEENPQARAWPALDPFGQPQPYSEFYRGTYRYRPCMTHDSYVAYVQRAALYLVEHVGAQWIHLDNNAAVPCYTERFLAHYRQHLAATFATDTAEGRARFEERFGFSSPQHMVIPRGSARLSIDSLAAAHEPNLQAWIDYRCSLLTGAYHQIVQAIKARHPQVGVDLNPPLHRGEFAPLVWGVDVDELSTHGDLMYAEDGLEPRLGSAGQIIGNFANYKFGQATGQRILVHASGSPLDLMEAAVHNRACLGKLAWGDSLPEPNHPTLRQVAWIRQQADLFLGATPISDIAVLRGRRALINQWSEAWQSLLMTWQTLTRYGLQWDMVLERHLGDLQRYRLLILPNTISLGESELRQIATFVRGGGRVLAIEQAGRCDAWGRSRGGAVQELDAETDAGLGSFRPRQAAAFSDLLGLRGEAAQRVSELAHLPHPNRWRWQPLNHWHCCIGPDHWLLPENAGDLVQLIREALGHRPLLCHEAPAEVVPQLMRDAEGTTLHLLNYRAGSPSAPLRLNLGFAVSSARALTLGEDRWHAFPVSHDPATGQARLEIPSFETWMGIRLQPADA